MLSISRLAEKCRTCKNADKCNNKRMEACAYYPDPHMAELSQPLTAELAAPVLRETITINIDGTLQTVYKDEIEKELYKQLYCGLGLNYEA